MLWTDSLPATLTVPCSGWSLSLQKQLSTGTKCAKRFEQLVVTDSTWTQKEKRMSPEALLPAFGSGYTPADDWKSQNIFRVLSSPKNPADELLFQLNHSHGDVPRKAWPGVIVGGTESQPALTDDSQMQNKFFNANRMQLVFWDQAISASNTVNSAVFLQRKKIIP